MCSCAATYASKLLMSTASVSNSSSISDKAVNTSAEHNRCSNVKMAAHITNAIWNCLLLNIDIILCVCVYVWVCVCVLCLCEIDKMKRSIRPMWIDSLRISHWTITTTTTTIVIITTIAKKIHINNNKNLKSIQIKRMELLGSGWLTLSLNAFEKN